MSTHMSPAHFSPLPLVSVFPPDVEPAGIYSSSGVGWTFDFLYTKRKRYLPKPGKTDQKHINILLLLKDLCNFNGLTPKLR